MERTECFETSAHKTQTQQNHTKERIQHSQHGESLKSRLFFITAWTTNERGEGLHCIRMWSFVYLMRHFCVFSSKFYGTKLPTMEYEAETSNLSSQHNGNEERGRK
jgi:hypothetical protein